MPVESPVYHVPPEDGRRAPRIEVDCRDASRRARGPEPVERRIRRTPAALCTGCARARRSMRLRLPLVAPEFGIVAVLFPPCVAPQMDIRRGNGGHRLTFLPREGAWQRAGVFLIPVSHGS